jgi:Hint module/Metallo-peptidase family M12/PT repeat
MHDALECAKHQPFLRLYRIVQIELELDADSSFCAASPSNGIASQAVAHRDFLFAYAQDRFKHAGVLLLLKNSDIYCDAAVDPYKVPVVTPASTFCDSSPTTDALSLYKSYMASRGNFTDLSHLIFSKGLPGAVGCAYLSTVCSPTNAFGASDIGGLTNTVHRALTMTHEIGHNAGASHVVEDTIMSPNNFNGDVWGKISAFTIYNFVSSGLTCVTDTAQTCQQDSDCIVATAAVGSQFYTQCRSGSCIPSCNPGATDCCQSSSACTSPDAPVCGQNYQCGGNVPMLVSNQIVTITAPTGSFLNYYIPVRFQDIINCTLSVGTGGGGDGDLYMQFNDLPTLNSYNCRPYTSGSNESCTRVAASTTVKVFVSVNAYNTLTNLKLQCSISSLPTAAPTRKPTTAPTKVPTKAPTKIPTLAPTKVPTKAPIVAPSKAPTMGPTKVPSKSPVTAAPVTPNPTQAPVKGPTTPWPTNAPSKIPTKKPTNAPTKQPTRFPTKASTRAPTRTPTRQPTRFPTRKPTRSPTGSPVTSRPTRRPTLAPNSKSEPVAVTVTGLQKALSGEQGQAFAQAIQSFLDNGSQVTYFGSDVASQRVRQLNISFRGVVLPSVIVRVFLLIAGTGSPGEDAVGMIKANRSGAIAELQAADSSFDPVTDILAEIKAVAQPTNAPARPPPTAAPIKVSSFGGKNSPGMCFSASNTVHVRGKGQISIDQLSIGDFVEVDGNNSFSRVISFSHMDNLSKALYLQVFTEGRETPLEISHAHMVILPGYKTVRAGDLTIGDKLSGGKLVTRMETITSRGLYAPVTESGTIVVSDIQASSYVALFDLPATIQHYAYHTALGSMRILCNYDFGRCEQETYTDGISNYIFELVRLLMGLSNLPILLQALGGMLLAGPVLVTIAIIEYATSYPAAAIAFVIGCLVLRSPRQKKRLNGKNL